METLLFEGFLKRHWKILFAELIHSKNIIKCHMVQIYTEWDICAAKHHRDESKKGYNPYQLFHFYLITI